MMPEATTQNIVASVTLSVRASMVHTSKSQMAPSKSMRKISCVFIDFRIIYAKIQIFSLSAKTFFAFELLSICHTQKNFIHIIKLYIMSDYDKKHRNRTSLWIAIGAIVLIVLLLIWLTTADLWGDTDVAAFLMSPML